MGLLYINLSSLEHAGQSYYLDTYGRPDNRCVSVNTEYNKKLWMTLSIVAVIINANIIGYLEGWVFFLYTDQIQYIDWCGT